MVVYGLVASSSGQGSPLDPNGTAPAGAKALVLLLREYGAQVTIDTGVPSSNVSSAVVLTDRLNDAGRSDLMTWVRGGGRLVVADPASSLQVGVPTAVGNGLIAEDLQPSGGCALPGLDGVGQLSVGPSLLLRVAAGDTTTACYSAGTTQEGDVWFLVAQPVGSGLVIGLGGAGLWTNARLDQLDNAALAVDLLAPSPGARVDVLVGSGAQSSVLAILNPRLKWALIELVVAFGVLVWWRGRRFGRAITESSPVKLAGSELVSAAGELMARSGNRDAAAQQLRDAAIARIGTALGLGPRAGVEVVTAALEARLGLPTAGTLATLRSAPVVDDSELVRLAQALAELDQEVTRGRSPARV